MTFRASNYKKLHAYVKDSICENKWTYVFIDEIQNCPDYERAVSSLYLRKNIEIYITGSNAHMLSGELATKLTPDTSKSICFHFPLLNIASSSTADNANALINTSIWARFPSQHACGQFVAHTHIWRAYTILSCEKDVMTREGLRDITLVKSIARFLASNVGSLFSAKKIADTLTSYGRPTGSATVDTYLNALTDAYLFYKVDDMTSRKDAS
jgi:predicted AAA+ superfamily ATPase